MSTFGARRRSVASAAALTLVLSGMGIGSAYAVDGVSAPTGTDTGTSSTAGTGTDTGNVGTEVKPAESAADTKPAAPDADTGAAAPSADVEPDVAAAPALPTSYDIGGETFDMATKDVTVKVNGKDEQRVWNYVQSKSGNLTDKCQVKWVVSATNDPTLDDYANNGFGRKIKPARYAGFNDPGWSELQHWGSGGTTSWRLPVTSDDTVLNATWTIALPAEAEYTFAADGAAGFFNTHTDAQGKNWHNAGGYTGLSDKSPSFKHRTKTTINGVDVYLYTFELGTLLKGKGYSLMITGTGGTNPATGYAKLTGTYFDGSASCPASKPDLPTYKPIEKCEFRLTGRTVRPLDAADVTVRDKWGDAGETNADGWGGYSAPTFRLYGRADKAATNVTYTATAAQGFTFTSVDAPGSGGWVSPSRYLNKAGKPNSAIELAEGEAPVISADGKTITLKIKRMPANSSFSFNATAKPDGSRKVLVIDQVLAGALENCSINPPPTGGGGGSPVTPAPTPEPKPEPKPTKPEPEPK
ncbi:MAG: hypothetical protein Q4G51_10740, partial [Dermatophilus congolensis]|nr:hypothetical protein [Dermatophilus congolensis]